MAKVYITFGQSHAHATPKGTVDKDCVGVIHCLDYADGRAKAFEWFDGKFHNCYSDKEWADHGEETIKYFPNGLKEVN